MKLKRELGLLEVFCIASGTMISSGLFVLPALAFAQAGPAIVASYFFAALFAMTGMFSQAELVSAMPKSGGTYFYVSRSMGPAVGIIDGMITWFSLSLKSAFALVGMAAFVTIVCPNIDVHLIAITLCLLFVIINIIGAKETGRTQIFLVAGLFGVLGFYIIKGIPAVNIHNFEPFAPAGFSSILAVSGFVFVSYGGLLKIASIAEEVKNPSKTVPFAMVLSLVAVSVLYILVVFVTSGTGILKFGTETPSLMPISDGATVILGNKGKIILSIAAILAFVSTANAGIMAASRYLYASGKDKILPESFANVNKKFGTPHVAILVTGAFMVAALFLDLRVLVKAASAVLILTFIFSCLCVIILRESRLQNYQPKFKSPLYPWMQIAGIIGCSLLLLSLGAKALITSASFVATGFFIYWFYGRIRTNREFALLHLIERITARELTTRSMENELREIVRERDEIVKDKFDELVEKACVLDFEKKLTRNDFFQKIASALVKPLELSEKAILEKLAERENQSTTALTPFLAIPHIIVEGEHSFSLLIARCKNGIFFSDEDKEIKAVFVLAGTMDERPFHLRALAAVAGIVQDPHFEEKWLAAKDEDALRDILLLGKRRRFV